MSTGTTEFPPGVPLPPDWEQTPAEWRDEYAKLWLQTKLGFEGFMLEKLQQQHQRVMQVADAAWTGKAPEQSEPPEGDEMGVSIGNKEYHVHYEAPKTDTNTVTNPAPIVPAPVKSGLSKLALAGMLGATGIGASGVTAAFMSYLNQPRTTIVQPGDKSPYDIGGYVKPLE